jgi:hypothetical protein
MDATWFIPSLSLSERETPQTCKRHTKTGSTSTLGMKDGGMISLLLCGPDWSVLMRLVLGLYQTMYLGSPPHGQPVPRMSEPRTTTQSMWIVTTKQVMREASDVRLDDGVLVNSMLEKVQIKYVENLYDVIRLGSVFHLLERDVKPSMVVLHGLDVMVGATSCSHGSHGVERLLCRALAVMKDAVGYDRVDACVCATWCSGGMDDLPPYYYIVSRWLEEMYGCFKKAAAGGDGGYDVCRIAMEDGPRKTEPVVMLSHDSNNGLGSSAT